MSGAQCSQIEARLPWYLNSTGSASAKLLLEEHVAGCPSCAGRLSAERLLFQKIRDASATPVPDTNRAWQRFEHSLGNAAPLAATAAAPAPRSLQFLRAIAMAQAAALALMAVAVMYLLSDRDRAEPRFRTVTTPNAEVVSSGLLLRVAVTPTVTPGELVALAREHGAIVIAGPTPQGVYTLELTLPTLQNQALERLRAAPGLLLVEPVMTAAGGVQ
jgi:Putative zinc-finger